MSVIDRRLGISEQGNVIEIVTHHGKPQERRLVHKTMGIDRRARKRVARAWIAERERTSPSVRTYSSVAWTTAVDGIIRTLKPITIAFAPE